MSALTWLALITLLLLIGYGMYGVLGAHTIACLGTAKPLRNGPLPPVSIVIAARNEAEKIEEALSSLLRLDYAPLEIIVVNDRSEDQTGTILNAMACRFPQLRVITISHLPAGWLGKNHALQRGAEQACGDFLLFTDADVVMEATTLRRAMAVMLSRPLDHVTLFFKAELPSLLLRMVTICFGVGLVAALRPWRARKASSRQFIGVGAFNLVRKQCYHQTGGHKAIRLCPLDDIMLGKLLKQHGYRQECFFGQRLIRVNWYNSLTDMAQGLQKNIFAALDYRISALLAFTLIHLIFSIWPLCALLLTHGLTQQLNTVIVLLQTLFYLHAARIAHLSRKSVLFWPLAPVLCLAITWRAVLITLANGGIVWRGTRYDLDELKQGHPD